MTIEQLKEENLINGEIITGSHLYGLNNAQSDVDIKGFYKLPNYKILGFNYIDFVKDKKGDTNYYELGKFMGMLNEGNPNVLELLYAPDTFISVNSDLYRYFRREEIRSYFLTKQCGKTFGGYAMSQIKKARGLNKNIVQKMNKKKKSLIDFCYTIEGADSSPLSSLKNFNFGRCGVVKCQNGRNVYALYEDNNNHFNLKGLTKEAVHEDMNIDLDKRSNQIRLSSIPKLLSEIQTPLNFYFYEDGYRTYCKKYSEYWKWVENRNEARYNSTMNHGKGYDAKNLMHTFRLINCGIEIAKESHFHVNRTGIDDDFLLKIRNGEFEYDYLLDLATGKIEEMNNEFKNCSLPEKMSVSEMNNFLSNVRTSF